MKMLKTSVLDEYDLVVVGLGYESRSNFVSKKLDFSYKNSNLYALGYESNTECLSYRDNEEFFFDFGFKIISGEDDAVLDEFEAQVVDQLLECRKILIDITVMSRHRLASIMSFFLKCSLKGSEVTVVYAPSVFVEAPPDSTPIKKVSEISKDFTGTLGDLSKPASLIIGLGYEKNKALGLSSYFDSGSDFLFIPRSKEEKFENTIKENNKELLYQTKDSNIFYYNIDQPYSTYIDLRSLILSVRDYSRPVIVPLGPKILSAISIVIAMELYPDLPVWRVSSEHTEKPVERGPSGDLISFTVQI